MTGEQVSAGLVERLRGAPGFFAALSAEEWQVAAPYFSSRSLVAGDELWAAGGVGDHLACVLDGSLELKVDTEFPGKQIVVGVFSAGTVIGAAGMLESRPRSNFAKALEPATLLLLDRERFVALTDEHPRIGVKLLRGLLLAEANRLRGAYARLASIF